MCDLSNNDYDISYFGGRGTADENIRSYISYTNDFNLDDLCKHIKGAIDECEKEIKAYKKIINHHNENYQGYVDEMKLLLQIVEQEYDEQVYKKQKKDKKDKRNI